MMTQKEVSDLIKNSENKEWLENEIVVFSFPYLGIEFEKKGFLDLYQLIKREFKAWSKFEEGEIGDKLLESKVFWNTLFDLTENIIIHLKDGNSSFNRAWHSIVDNVSRAPKRNILSFDSKITAFLISLYKEDEMHYRGAFQYLIIPEKGIDFRTYREFEGAILAFEFKNADRSKFGNRRANERGALNKIKNDIENFYTKTTKEAHNTNAELTKIINSSKKISKQLISEQEKDFIDILEKLKEEKSQILINGEEKLSKLEKVYSDKLMLEEPAKFWDDRASDLKIEGNKWLNRLLWCSGISVVMLFIVLLSINANTIDKVFSNIGGTIRWSIVFITLISFLAYAIRTFAKLVFSTFHLVRDAEERKQLIYVYLSLMEKKGIEINERELILQSIFSRSDSGLLREDSSPTMPGVGGALGKILSRQS